MKKFLPIGSVVLLKESQKRIMIVGVKQKCFHNSDFLESGCKGKTSLC